MSFYDGMNEYATTKTVEKASYSGLENVLASATNVDVNTVLNEVFSFCSVINGNATIVLYFPSSPPADGCKVYDDGVEMSLSFSTTGTSIKYATIPIISGHTYVAKAKISTGTGKIDIFLNGTIEDNPRFFIKKI